MIGIIVATWCLAILTSSETARAGGQFTGQIVPGVHGSQMSWINHDGLFLLSNDSQFSFGFYKTDYDVTLFLLAVVHVRSRLVVWTANSASPVSNSDTFSFSDDGKVSLQIVGSGDSVWSIGGAGGASALQLRDSGNLVLVGGDGAAVWESFSHPTDTLLPGQNFVEGMRLVSSPSSNNLTYFMKIESGDVTLYAGFGPPQPYWSMGRDSRRTINKPGSVAAAVIEDDSWKFYDSSRQTLVWQFVILESTAANASWIAVLGSDGVVTFVDLWSGGSSSSSSASKVIPSDACSKPLHCPAYYECFSGDNRCQCPSGLGSRANCFVGNISACGETEMVDAGEGLFYFALEFVEPVSKGGGLEACKSSCQRNCSCAGMFFQNSTGSCFLFDTIGNFQDKEDSSFVTYVKVSSNGANYSDGESSGKHFPIVVIIVISTIAVICLLIFLGYRYYRRKRRTAPPNSPHESSEDDNFLECLSGMPVRFSYADLQSATKNFSEKLGQGGFGSVYLGELRDGTRLAVKKLEGIGQGKKEFRAEVSIIGSIHHLHLVRLKGFCVEGSHRLLAYEFMAKGSLDRWIFRRKKGEDHPIVWDTRFNIAVETAKGLAYLHEDCDAKIVHCDIKPENVLLDDNFHAKVSDFGLAKLMTREQSHVFTTMRGTRGYLAPEWITNYAISEKSDVYSYGMLLLEIIAGRKNYDPTETSDKSHFPSYAFRMLEEGKLRDILDWKVDTPEADDRVNTAIKVALWCIQEDMNLRPSMTKVVQMLEGLCPVPPPPASTPLGSRFFSGFIKSTSDEGTSSGPSEYNSDAYLSAVRLSGPR